MGADCLEIMLKAPITEYLSPKPSSGLSYGPLLFGTNAPTS